MCFVCLGDGIDPSTGEICARCEGSGKDPDPAAWVCPLCDGLGTITDRSVA
jgi:DnaJ-class molecular chaperone